MKNIHGLDLCKLLDWSGRIFFDNENKLVFFNWTNSGCEFAFEGKMLCLSMAGFSSVVEHEIRNIKDHKINTQKVEEWPWIAIVIDDDYSNIKRVQINSPDYKLLLHLSENVEYHRFKIVKLSEVVYRLALKKVIYDGSIISDIRKEELRIEFIGDSITCGFGNRISEVQRGFSTFDEDGMMSFASIIGRRMNCRTSLVSLSGVTLNSDMQYMPYQTGMIDLYLYTDRLLQESGLVNRSDLQFFDFGKCPSDIVVINLGTNDATAIAKANNPTVIESLYEDNYLKLIKQIRKMNSADTKIICTLGPIDYYLFDNIIHVVEEYKKRYQDEYIYTFKFKKMLFETEEVGPAMHPTIIKHERMAAELLDYIHKFL